MKYARTGIILNTRHYSECVAFYKDIMGLPVLYAIDREDEQLTCFDFGGAYLMVETGGVSHDGPKPMKYSPVKLRFNVADIEAACRVLRERGLTVDISRHDWGMTAEFIDPDGNRCALRSDTDFDPRASSDHGDG